MMHAVWNVWESSHEPSLTASEFGRSSKTPILAPHWSFLASLWARDVAGCYLNNIFCLSNSIRRDGPCACAKPGAV